MDLDRHPWARDGVRIPKSVLAQIEAHACEAYAQGLALDDAFEGEEACGVIVGDGHGLLADEAIRWPNLANRYHAVDPGSYPRTGRMYFLIDPLKFSKAARAADEGGRPFKVLYHSHLDVGAYFSDTDVQAALAGGTEPAYDLAFLVVSVRGDRRGGGAHVDDRKLFVWDDKTSAFVAGSFVVE